MTSLAERRRFFAIRGSIAKRRSEIAAAPVPTGPFLCVISFEPSEVTLTVRPDGSVLIKHADLRDADGLVHDGGTVLIPAALADAAFAAIDGFGDDMRLMLSLGDDGYVAVGVEDDRVRVLPLAA